MKINKWALWSVIGVAVAGTAIYVTKQVKKMMDYTLIFKSVKVNKFSLEILDFNAYFDYKNNSDIDIRLAEQEYDIYVNNVFITTLKNYKENVLKANSVSELGFNVNLNLPELDKKLKVNYFKMIAEPKSVLIRIEMKWKVRFGLFKIPIKYSWNTNLKEILGWYLPMYRK
jgi:LEA14-like dessication related protein